jgi:hypothetical protein
MTSYVDAADSKRELELMGKGRKGKGRIINGNKKRRKAKKTEI